MRRFRFAYSDYPALLVSFIALVMFFSALLFILLVAPVHLIGFGRVRKTESWCDKNELTLNHCLFIFQSHKSCMKQPHLVKTGTAMEKKGRLVLTRKGRRELSRVQAEYDRVPKSALDRLMGSLNGKVQELRRLPGIMSGRIAISGERLSITRLEKNNGKTMVVKGAFFPHTVTKRQYQFMQALERTFNKFISSKSLKPRYYSFRPVKYLAADGKFLVSRYYHRPSVGDIVFELDRKHLLRYLNNASAEKEINSGQKSRSEKRIYAILELGQKPGEESISRLERILKYGDSVIDRGFACYALGLTGNPRVRSMLNKARVSDKNAFVRWRAAVAMDFLKKTQRGITDKNKLFPRKQVPSIFLTNNPGINYQKIEQMFNELKNDVKTIEPAVRERVKKEYSYKQFHVDEKNIGNVLVFGFNGKDRFTVGLIDQG